MKDFITRIKNAVDGNVILYNEPLPFIFLVGFIRAFQWGVIIIFVFLGVLTVPLWGIPYCIYSVLKNKKR